MRKSKREQEIVNAQIEELKKTMAPMVTRNDYGKIVEPITPEEQRRRDAAAHAKSIEFIKREMQLTHHIAVYTSGGSDDFERVVDGITEDEAHRLGITEAEAEAAVAEGLAAAAEETPLPVPEILRRRMRKPDGGR